jgi:dolichyl-phosphate-mannose-protein mannosyltransferase
MFTIFTRFLRSHYVMILLIILCFAFATRLYHLSQPKAYIFDEVYHAVTAKLIARNDPRAYEWWNPPIEPNTAVDWLHPPYAKYTQALGMLIFGENSIGWRISAVVFGVLVVAATAKLALELFENKPLALLAGLLAALDGLLLVQSRIAMNDIHVTFMILLTCICYVRFRKNPGRPLWLFLTGVCAGISIGTKWSGMFGLGIIGISEVVIWTWTSLQQPLKKKSKQIVEKFPVWLVKRFVFLVLVPAFMYLAAYSQMFLQGKSLICEGNQVQQGQCFCRQDSSWWVNILKGVSPDNSGYWESLEARGGCKRLVSHFSELHHQIWWYQTNLQATHPYQSRPLEWFLDLRPVWMYVDYGQDTLGNIYAQGNPSLFWAGDTAVIATLLLIIWLLIDQIAIKKKFAAIIKIPHFAQMLFLLGAYFIVWLPWQLSPRIMFFYHYTPAVPLLCILLAFWLRKLWEYKPTKKDTYTFSQSTVIAIVLVIFANFVLFYPNWVGIPLPKEWVSKVYFALPTWH